MLPKELEKPQMRLHYLDGKKKKGRSLVQESSNGSFQSDQLIALGGKVLVTKRVHQNSAPQ